MRKVQRWDRSWLLADPFALRSLPVPREDRLGAGGTMVGGLGEESQPPEARSHGQPWDGWRGVALVLDESSSRAVPCLLWKNCGTSVFVAFHREGLEHCHLHSVVSRTQKQVRHERKLWAEALWRP